jgi:hypothetical protein
MFRHFRFRSRGIRSLEQMAGRSRPPVKWLGEAQGVTARDLFAAPATEVARSAQEDVKEFIQAALTSGPRLRSYVTRELREAGLSTASKTVQRVRGALRIVSRREGFGPGAEHLWQLPGYPWWTPFAEHRDRVQHVHYGNDGVGRDPGPVPSSNCGDNLDWDVVTLYKAYQHYVGT